MTVFGGLLEEGNSGNIIVKYSTIYLFICLFLEN
jgi:hypothetical protein